MGKMHFSSQNGLAENFASDWN